MVEDIRKTEIILGSDEKKPVNDEEEMRLKMGRSIVAKEDILPGTIITKEMLTVKIPGTGLAPKEIDNLVGLKARFYLSKDQMIKRDDLINNII